MSARPERRLAVAAAVGLGCVLLVLFVSAAIRLGEDLGGTQLWVLRAVHRSAASLEVLAMLAAAWLGWRMRASRPALALAAALTVALSVLGILAGQQPPPLAAYGNLTLGLALAASFAWVLGDTKQIQRHRAARVAAALLIVQVLLGAWIAIYSETLWSWALAAHALLGLALGAGTIWLATRIERAAARFAVAALALAVPAAGFAAALFDLPFGAALAHAVAAALFVSVAAYGHARIA